MTDDDITRQRHTAAFEADFMPRINKFGQSPSAEDRIAEAAEYGAYQLGQIRKLLARLIEAAEKKG